jgi:hypothetical protein
MENKIASFEEFRKRASDLTEDSVEMEGQDHHEHREHQHYMFFQNIASIKHHIEEILKMNPEEIDNLLKNGHDWASDHIATSKDDIQEVAEWIRNEMREMGEQGEEEEEESGEETGMIEPENIKIEIEGDDDNVEIEDGEKEETEEEDEDE